MDQRWTKIRELFRAALDVDEEQREAFLLEQCPDDHDIRERVSSMLRAYNSDDTFLESPVAPLGQRFASKKGHESLVGTKVGPYQIRRVIAQGGMGVVFEALDTKLEKIVALKMMNPALMQDESFKNRFEQEAKTLAKLEDPHFVRVIALVEDQHNTFIVMEYINGKTLAEHIRAKGKLTDREVARIGLQLLTALSKAHKQNIIHRDLKPSNIMLTRSNDGRILVKVLDFGIAKNIQSSNTITRTMGTVGTLYYMSPEQIRALRNIDHRTDIYSSGVTLYEALNGALPFDITKDEFTIRKQIVEGRLHETTDPDNDSQNPVERVLAKALQIDPAERFQSADEMRAALLAAIREYVPQPDQPGSIGAQARPGKKRKFAQIALAIGSLLILIPVIMYAMTGSLPSPLQLIESSEQPSIENPEPLASESISSAMAMDSMDTTPLIADSLDTRSSDTLSQSPASPSDTLAQTSEPSLSSEIEEQAELVDNTPGDSAPPLSLPDSTEVEPTDLSAETNESTPTQSLFPTGTITLLIRPPGNLIVNDEDLGQVVIKPVTLTSEYHRFVIRNEEYGTWACSMFVPGNESIEKNVHFDQPVSIPVVTMLPDSTYIPNAEILLDNVPTGAVTPMAVRVSPGLRSIGARLDGYTQEEVRIEGAEGCFQKISSRINFDHSIDYRDKRVIVILSRSE